MLNPKKRRLQIRKIKIPNNPLQKTLTKSKLKQLELDNIRAIDGTPEQRQERKSLYKEVKRERRMLKKENKLAVKNEERQITQAISAKNNSGMKLI